MGDLVLLEADKTTEVHMIPEGVENSLTIRLLDGVENQLCHPDQGSDASEGSEKKEELNSQRDYEYLEGMIDLFCQDLDLWQVVPNSYLPQWLKNSSNRLQQGHRPPLPSFRLCFKSIFRVHTETGNIWTHLLGGLFFAATGVSFFSQTFGQLRWQELVLFGTFFSSLTMCMGFSFLFHTVCCHSERVSKLFSKLDYCGIAMLLVGSMVPWGYYGFYCNPRHTAIYLPFIVCLGSANIAVSLWDRFGTPHLRSLRSGVFVGFGFSSVVPALHYSFNNGWIKSTTEISAHSLVVVAICYTSGTALYCLELPERLFPGKCDIWPQSHQIFHVFVMIGAVVHFHLLTELAIFRMALGDCAEEVPIALMPEK